MTERVIQPAEVGAAPATHPHSEYAQKSGDTFTGNIFVNDPGQYVGIQAPAPGFWLDETPSKKGLFVVQDNEVVQFQRRASGFGAYEARVMRFWLNAATDPNLYVHDKQVWDTGNDGPGSGLDADTVDGSQAADFAPASLGQTTKVSQSEVGAQSVANATWTGVVFDTEDRDDGAYYDPLSPGSVVLPAGVHLVDFYGDWDVNSTGLRVTRFLMDGVVVFTDVGTNAANVAAGRMVPNTVLVSGGTLTVEVYQSSGAALTFNRPTSTPNPYLQVVRIG